MSVRPASHSGKKDRATIGEIAWGGQRSLQRSPSFGGWKEVLNYAVRDSIVDKECGGAINQDQENHKQNSFLVMSQGES